MLRNAPVEMTRGKGSVRRTVCRFRVKHGMTGGEDSVQRTAYSVQCVDSVSSTATPAGGRGETKAILTPATPPGGRG